MKKQILILTAIIVFATATGCSNVPKEKKGMASNTVALFNTNTMHMIPLDSAKGCVNFYGTFSRDIKKKDAVQAFTISGIDLLQVLGLDTSYLSICRFRSARAYLGISGLEAFPNNYHLYLTPVNDEGKDVILKGPANIAGKIVFDLTTPCPNTCDSTSELYQAFYTPVTRPLK